MNRLRLKKFTFIVLVSIFFLVVLVFAFRHLLLSLILLLIIPFTAGEDRLEHSVVVNTGLTASYTPQWSFDGRTIIVRIDNRIVGVSTDGNELWNIASMHDSNHEIRTFSLSRNGQVAYVKYDYNDGIFAFLDANRDEYEIRSVNIDGTDDKAIISLGKEIRDPVWSPDGSRLAFTVVEESEAPLMHRLGTTAYDGSDIHIFETLANPGRPAWSGDGQRLLFVGFERIEEYDGYRHLSHVRWDGTDKKTVAAADSRLTILPSFIAWSNADDFIYFAKASPSYYSGEPIDIYAIRSDGSDQSMISEVGDYSGSPRDGAHLSPDGAQMLFVYGYMLRSEVLHVIHTDGTGLRKIVIDSYYESRHPYRRLHASWSPDGNRIAVLLNSHDPVALFSMNPDGSDANLLIKRENGILLPGHGEPLPPATILPVDEDLSSTP